VIDPTEQDLALISHGNTLAWKESGTGVPVVMLHSGGLSGRQWRKLGVQLASSYRVIIPDLLGYGGSTAWPYGRPFHFGLDLAELDLLLAYAGEPVHLVGHSYGGLLAFQLALADSSRIRTMALFEPTTFGILDPIDDADALAGLSGVRLTWDAHPAGGVDESWLEGFVDWWNGPGSWGALGNGPVYEGRTFASRFKDSLGPRPEATEVDRLIRLSKSDNRIPKLRPLIHPAPHPPRPRLHPAIAISLTGRCRVATLQAVKGKPRLG